MKVEPEAGVGVAGGHAFIEIGQKEEQPPQQRRHGIQGSGPYPVTKQNWNAWRFKGKGQARKSGG